MLRGVDRFYAEYNRYPGECNDDVEPDIVQVKGCIAKLLGEWGSGPLSKDDYVHEISRYGGCELHSISSFVGESNSLSFLFYFIPDLSKKLVISTK